MITIIGDYERASIDTAASSVAGNVITMAPLLARSNDIVSGETRWLEPSAEISGVLGTTPILRWTRMHNNMYGENGSYHYPPWQASRRCMLSEDGGRTWQYFARTAVNIGGGYVEFQHDRPFTVDRVRVSRARQMSVHHMGDWIAEMHVQYPGMFKPAPSAIAFMPSTAIADYAAQGFVYRPA